VEKLPGQFDVPEELDLRTLCLEQKENSADDMIELCYRYQLSGAIVHVDPVEEEEEAVYGEASEGHYVTFVRSSADTTPSTSSTTTDPPQDKNDSSVTTWIELDDDVVRTVSDSGPVVSNADDATSPTVQSTISGNASVEDQQHHQHQHPAMKVLSGCDASNDASNKLETLSDNTEADTSGKRASKKDDRRYATLVVYSRVC